MDRMDKVGWFVGGVLAAFWLAAGGVMAIADRSWVPLLGMTLVLAAGLVVLAAIGALFWLGEKIFKEG